MAIHWRLKGLLSKKDGILKLKDLQEAIIVKCGIRISLQHLSELVNGRPKSIKLSTMEIICTALDCNLSDFCDVRPKPSLTKKSKLRQLSTLNTPISKRNFQDFPNPNDY